MNLVITAEKMRHGKLLNVLPELYDLKNSVENSQDLWHQNETVFDHTLSVMDALEKILAENNALDVTLAQKIDSYSRRELLEIATAFHDIGKKEAMTKEGDFTKCAGHEAIGVEKTKKIFARFDLSEREKEIILDIIANHSVFHALTMPDNKNFEEDLDTLRDKFSKSIYPELVLLSYADTINSKLSSANPKEFKQRIDFYEKETKNLDK